MESDAQSSAPAESSVSTSKERPQGAWGPAATPELRHLDRLVKTGGQILIGAIKPLKRTAVAYDGTRTVAMLRYPADEPLESLLVRLDTAVANALKTGRPVDEVNRRGADRTYEY
jgi:hypothetical protein